MPGTAELMGLRKSLMQSSVWQLPSLNLAPRRSTPLLFPLLMPANALTRKLQTTGSMLSKVLRYKVKFQTVFLILMFLDVATRSLRVTWKSLPICTRPETLRFVGSNALRIDPVSAKQLAPTTTGLLPSQQGGDWRNL